MSQITEKKRGRGRPANFDREMVLDKITQKFWKYGYANVSLYEIAKEEGLTRTSLYNSFGSKEALFFECVARYYQSAPEYRLDHLSENEDVAKAFYEVLDEVCKTRNPTRNKHGCMMANCLNELASSDDVVGPQLTKMAEGRKENFAKLLARAENQGTFEPSASIKVLADLLYAFMCGLSTFSKAGTDEKEMRDLSFAFLRQLGFKDVSIL